MLLLAGCQPPAGDAPSPAPSQIILPVAGGAEGCLKPVWQAQTTQDRAFDLAHDDAEGGSISCATGTSASRFVEALATLRAAAASGDRTQLSDAIAQPLLFIDVDGNRRELGRDALSPAVLGDVFDRSTLDLLARLELGDLTVVAGQGAFVELGGIWLVADRMGGRPRIATVNHQALAEAAAAAARKAGDGRAIPTQGERP
ncbi:hypothetical protein [Tsuneonella sp. HG222]